MNVPASPKYSLFTQEATIKTGNWETVAGHIQLPERRRKREAVLERKKIIKIKSNRQDIRGVAVK